MPVKDSEALRGIIKNLDKGFYREAKALVDGPMPSYGYLAQMLAEKGLVPTQAEIDKAVKKLLARAGYKGFDPDILSSNVLDTAEQFAADSWALEQCLALEGIRIKGAGADRLEKFFATGASAVLFPSYVESQVVVGILAAGILNALVATTTNIDAHVYEYTTLNDSATDRKLRLMGEGADIPTTTIALSDSSIKLYKYGRMLQATYEALRLQRMNVVSIFLQRIGQQIAIDETDAAIETLLDGITDTDAEVSGTCDYDELTRLFLAFAEGYQMSDCVINSTNLRTILNMAEFKDPLAGFNFQRTGVLPGPMGAAWHRWDSTGSTLFSTDRILAVDSRYALERITEGGIVTESDKLIDKQFERTAITQWVGYAKIDSAAVHCLDITT